MEGLFFPMMGFARHRLDIDGPGVTTLVAASGCPLRCVYCLNPQCRDPEFPVRRVTPEELYALAKADDLYFQATGGGVTFGGGEPLLHAPFIQAFRRLSGDRWRITAETCLNIPAELLRVACDCVDGFIVDIKDMDPAVYKRYTGADNARVRENLEALLRAVGPERVLVRVPVIPGFNSMESVEAGEAALQAMGFTRIDRFTYRTA